MKRWTTVMLLALLACVALASAASAAEWQVLDGNVGLSDAGWYLDDVSGESALVQVVDDPEIAGNKLIQVKDDRSDYKEYWGFKWGADSSGGVTVVVRVRGLEGEYDKTFDFGVRNDLNDERIIGRPAAVELQYGVGSVELDTTAWHIYRVTVNGRDLTVYVDEDPTPVIQFTMSRTTSNNDLRFGAKETGGTTGSVYDWIVWRTDGAYAPSEGPALPGTLTGLK